jgi:Alternative complex III, ActD subunit
MSGILAAFQSEAELAEALAALRNQQYSFETYTPKPLEEHPTGSPLPLIMFIAGMVTFCGFFYLLTWVNVWNWPIDIGGRPLFSWPTFVPITFELGILAAVAAGFIGYFAINRMPRLYEPIDHCRSMQRALRDLWIVAVDSDNAERASELLAKYRPLCIEEIPAE